MTFIVSYWKELLIVILVGLAGLGYWLSVQNAKEAERTQIELELERQTQDTKETIRETIRNSQPVDRNDASDSLRRWEERQRND